MDTIKRVIILGAGLSGLACGWYVKKYCGNRVRVRILEQKERSGGLIKTVRKNGFLFEMGPHSWRTSEQDSSIDTLIQELGLQDHVIEPAPSAKTRYILHKGKLRKLPTTLFGTIFSPLTCHLFPTLLREFFLSSDNPSEETILDFSMRRFGKRTTELLFDPLVTGIYAGKIEDLSMQACFPKLVEWEKKYGSVTKGFLKNKGMQHCSLSFKNGMETLTHTLTKHLAEELQLSCKAVGIERTTFGMKVLNSNGVAMKSEIVVSALPSASIADLLAPHNTAIGALLTSIENASVAIVHLGYDSVVLKKQGFGYLIPTTEHEEVLGCIWDSELFPQQIRGDKSCLTMMIGGARHPNACWKRDEDLINLALDTAKRHMGIVKKPISIHVYRAHKAIPQYHLGHTIKINHLSELLKENFPGLYLIGPAIGGVAINDCISQAEKVAKEIAEGLT